jgi:hypothetical protein
MSAKGLFSLKVEKQIKNEIENNLGTNNKKNQDVLLQLCYYNTVGKVN